MPIDMPKGSKAGGLAEKIENTFIRFLLRVYDATIGNLSKRIKDGVDAYLEKIEVEAVAVVRPAAQEILAMPGLPGWVRNALERVAYPQHQAGVLAVGAAAVAVGTIALPRLLGPFLDRVAQHAMKLARPSLPDIFSAATMMHRGLLSPGDFTVVAESLGHRSEVIAAVIGFTERRVDPSDFVRYAYLAGLGEGQVAAYLQDLGYKAAELVALMNIYQLRPGPSDLVRMGVREAWRDDVAAKWGYDSDFPAQFGAEMQRAGDTEGWAQRYWRAHWELPSVNMVLEMLHRGKVTEDEFSEYLRIADYPAGWRARISEVAYTPYTRVDTRRMYRYGVLDEAGVYNTYRDIGYDHDHATAMTEFTVLDALTDERELTKTDILKSYRLARFTRAEAQTNLEALGYNVTVAGLLLSNEDQATEDAQISGVVSNTHSLYIRGGITKAEAMARFAGLNLATAEVDRYFELWDLEKESRVALPTRSALDGFLGDDIITVAQYEAGLGSLSYQPEAVAWYTQAVLLDKATRAEKEKDRAIAEAERVTKREVVTDYQRAKAVLTVDLREVEARIGELQTAIQARGLTYRADLDFALKRLSVEQLTAEYERVRALAQAEVDRLSIDTRLRRAEIEAAQTDIAELRLQLETVTDEALKEAARLQISTLQGHAGAIQTIQAEGRAEIATLEAEIAGLVDPGLTERQRADLLEIQTEVEEHQDAIAGYREEQAEIKLAMLDLGPDMLGGPKKLVLALQVQIMGELVTIDELQTYAALLREQNVDPDQADELHVRQELMAEIRANNAQATVLLQEIDEQIAEIRLAQIDPVRVEQVQVLRAEIATIAVDVDSLQDVMAENAVGIAAGQAGLRRLREGYQADLRDLQRVQSVAAIDAAYRTDTETLQAELGLARNSKNRIRVQLAEIHFEYTG